MSKRIFSFLLGLIILVSALPFGMISAEETTTPQNSGSVAAEITLTEPDFPEKSTTFKPANTFPLEANSFRALCTGSAKTHSTDWDPGASVDTTAYAKVSGGTTTIQDGWATFTEGDTKDTFRVELVLKSLVEEDTNYVAVDVDATGITDSKSKMTARFYMGTTTGDDTLYATAGQTYYYRPEPTAENPNPAMEPRVMSSSSSYYGSTIYLYPGDKGTFYFPETLFIWDKEKSNSNASNTNKDGSYKNPGWLNGIYGDFSKYLTEEWRLYHSSYRSNAMRFEFRSCIPANNSIAFGNVRWMSEKAFELDYNAEYITNDFSNAEDVSYTYWSGSNHAITTDNFMVENDVWKQTATAEDWTDESSALRYGYTLDLGYPVNTAFEALQFDVDFSNISVEPTVQLTYNLKNTNISASQNVRRYVVANGDIYAVWKSGAVETISVQNKEYPWIILPKGFDGTIVVPFESLRTMSVGGYTYDGTTVDLFKTDDVNNFSLTVDVSNIPFADKGDVITYDNFGYLTTLKPLTEVGTQFDAAAPIEVEKQITEEIKTVETWVKIPSGTAEGTILADKYRKSGATAFVLKMNAAGNPVLYLHDGAGQSVTFEVADVDLRTDKWTHIAFSKNETAINFYVNGTLKASTELPEDLGAVKPYHVLTIGHTISSELGTSTFGGEVANLKLWSKALTSTEILDSAINETKVVDGLIAAWSLYGENRLADITGRYDLEVYDLYITNTDEEYAKFNSIPEDGYTFVVLPDTQIAVQREAVDEVGTYTSFSNMYDWIIANKDSQNIKFVMGVGDITNKDRAEEYTLAKSNFDRLTAANIPWSVVGGNHDFKNGNAAPYNTTNLNTYFPASELSTLAGFGGFMKSDEMDNSYYYVTVNETKYLILNLCCEPDNAALEWANQVCIKNSDCKVIVVTHEYLTNDAKFFTGGYTGRNRGADVWNKFVSQHKNIIMAIGGHVAVPDIQYNESYGVNGNKVINVLVDGQALDWNPTHNMVMLLKFSADGSKVTFDYYSTAKDAYLDANNHFTLDVDGVISDEALPTAPKADYTYSKYHSAEVVRNFEWFVNDGNISVWSDLKTSATSSSQFSWYNNMLKYETADEFEINEETGNPYEKDRIGITFKKLPNVVNEKQTALSFYVDRSSAKYTTYIRTRFTCGGGTYQPGKGSIAYYIADNGEITMFENGSNWSSVALPAGFKGTVVIPFTSFKTNDGNGDFIDTSKVLCETQQNNAQFTMYIMEARADEEYIFNNFSYLEEYNAGSMVSVRNGILGDQNGELIDVNGDTFVDARDIVRLKKVLANFYVK